MARYDYNLVVIGAGSGGLTAAEWGALLGARVALVEKHKMGGDCLNTGCVPSKSLIRSAKIAQLFSRHALFGLDQVRYRVDFAALMERVQEVVGQVGRHDRAERYERMGVEVYMGAASIRSPHEVAMGERVLRTAHIIVATGARPFLPPVEGLEQIQSLHSDNLWELRRQPRRLLVVGGGPIGCELAQALARLGSEVTLVDMLPAILPREDAEVVEFVRRAFGRDGIRVLTSTRLRRFESGEGGDRAVCEREGGEVVLDFDRLLIAAGRRANSAGLGLEEVGVELERDGTVKVDRYMRSSVPSIYACGDVAGPYQFTHTAAQQAWHCVMNALFGPLKRYPVDYSVLPWVTFTDPEVARLGLSQTEARDEGIAHEVTTYELGHLDRALTAREAEGVVRVLTPPGSDKILGVSICGSHAGEMLAEFALAMKHGIGLEGILATIHPYPTLAEANRFAALEWRKNHLSERTRRWLRKFHTWRR